jgi:hypothetical protein
MREFSFFSAWATTIDSEHLGLLYLALTWEDVEHLAGLARRALSSGRRDGDFRRVAKLRAGTLLRFDGAQFATSTLVCRASRSGSLRLEGTSSGRPFNARLGYAESLVRGWSDGRPCVLADYLNGRLAFPVKKD